MIFTIILEAAPQVSEYWEMQWLSWILGVRLCPKEGQGKPENKVCSF